MEDIIVYTDGGCWPNPGVGGWGVVIQHQDGRTVEHHGGEKYTTNNRMELTGPIVALELLPRDASIVVMSDSRYVIDGITEWIAEWKRRGWRNSRDMPVKSRDLWERLDAARNDRKVSFAWIKGHAGNVGNERADELSKLGAVQVNEAPIDFDAITASYRRRR